MCNYSSIFPLCFSFFATIRIELSTFLCQFDSWIFSLCGAHNSFAEINENWHFQFVPVFITNDSINPIEICRWYVHVSAFEFRSSNIWHTHECTILKDKRRLQCFSDTEYGKTVEESQHHTYYHHQQPNIKLVNGNCMNIS